MWALRAISPVILALVALCATLAARPAEAAARLVLLGTFDWQLARKDFGGLSGLAVQDGGARLLSISDEGELFEASVTRDDAGRIAGIDLVQAARPLDNFGKPVSGFRQDAEGMTFGQDGRLYLSFEGYARVAGFQLWDMTPHPMNRWDEFRAIWGNQGFESLATLPDGRLMTILEVAQDGAYHTKVHDADGWHDGPSLPAAEGYQASGADVGPDGRLYLLERDFGLIEGYSTRIRRFQITPDGFAHAETLYEAGHGGSMNYEGISLWKDASGRTVVSLVSDNNFDPLIPTRLAEFVLDE